MDIKILPQHIADQIAAGEVVERPASVVKELIENSIDANSTDIKISIDDGGLSKIEIEDNGKGISKKNLPNAILRHATSKIESIDDLFSIYSFGFRGEALAAIASVSKCTIISKTKESDLGYKLTIQGGLNQNIEESPANNGTRIIIEDIFYTTPARREYLKSETTEYQNILKEITYFALSHHNIRFSLIKNGKQTLSYPITEKHSQRIEQVLSSTQKNLLEIKGKTSNSEISGFISRPGEFVNSKNRQYTFVNGRHIQDYRLTYAIREAYTQTCGLENHLHPIFVIFIKTDPLLVDVNVHPRKLEVKFSDPQEIFSLVRNTVINQIENNNSSYQATSFSSTQKQNYNHFKPQITQSNQSFSKQLFSGINQSTNSFSELNKQRNFSTENASNPLPVLEKKQDSPLKSLGQVNNKYLIAESSDGIYIFDQHALHERERFDIFWKKYKDQQKEIQKLLTPQIIELPEEEIELFASNKKTLEDIGLKITFPEDTKLEIHEIPTILTNIDLDKVINQIKEHLQNFSINENICDQIMRKLLEYKSCRGSVMFGDKLSEPETQKLLNDFQKTKYSDLCPHGRPNHIFWSFEDLNQMFHR